MRLGTKVRKVMRVGKKALAVAGATLTTANIVGGAWLGVKNVQHHREESQRRESRKREAGEKAKEIMDRLDKERLQDK